MNKHRRAGMEDSKPMVPIIPMLDLTFQLLFFFITLFDPSSGVRNVEGQMDLTLPAKKDDKKQASRPEDVLPDVESDKDMDLDLPADLTVVVTTQLDGINDGNISSLFVEDRTGKTTVEYDKKLTELVSYLKNYLKEQGDAANKSSIRVQGDSKLKWEEMVHVMDACREAGFESVGFLQPPDFHLNP